MMSAHENWSRRYANIYAFVKNFLGRIVFQRSDERRSGWQPTNAATSSVDGLSIVVICVDPGTVVGFDNL